MRTEDAGPTLDVWKLMQPVYQRTGTGTPLRAATQLPSTSSECPERLG